MNKEDWDWVEEQLKSLYHTVNLKIDGYRVTISLNRMGTYKNSLVVYVNDWFKGEWLGQDCEERRRFFRPCTSYLFPKKVREKLNKKRYPNYHKPHTYWQLDWPGFKRMKAHFIKNNQSIELIKEG